MADHNTVPKPITRRVHRYLVRRGALTAAASLLQTVAVCGLVTLVALGLDAALTLPAAVRYGFKWTIVIFFILGLVRLGQQALRWHARRSDLRRLDNDNDDLQAAMNLASRLHKGDKTLSPRLADETIRRGETTASTPLPPLKQEKHRLFMAAAATIALVVVILGLRVATPDLHTAVARLHQPQRDVGTVGARKFQIKTAVWHNPPTPIPGAGSNP